MTSSTGFLVSETFYKVKLTFITYRVIIRIIVEVIP